MENLSKPAIEIPEKAPFGATIFWGKKGTGKTLLAINSPWLPVHVIDTENSSKEYHMHQKKLIELGILQHEFTRVECLDYPTIQTELYRIVGYNPKTPQAPRSAGEHYGTIVIDTGGQWSEWVANLEHGSANSDKLAQIVWGKIRDRLRRTIIELSGHCNCLLLTAHEREYQKVFSPRCNPALLEVAAISIRLQRKPNEQLPTANFVATRIPFFPPSVHQFTIMKMLEYFGKPADWNHLEPEDMIPDEPAFVGPPEEEA